MILLCTYKQTSKTRGNGIQRYILVPHKTGFHKLCGKSVLLKKNWHMDSKNFAPK